MKTKVFFLLLILVFCSANIYTQHKIPLGTKGNKIELSLKNSQNLNSSVLTIQAIDTPEWIEFLKNKIEIENLKQEEIKTVSFVFDVDKSAPIEEEYSILFQIDDGNGNIIYKNINIIITNPDKFELFQNYPNPFNPSTKIYYFIPKETFVNISIFNLLGEKVKTLINEEQIPGYYEIEFNAGNFATGVYFYTLKTDNFLKTKKFILMK